MAMGRTHVIRWFGIDLAGVHASVGGLGSPGAIGKWSLGQQDCVKWERSGQKSGQGFYQV